MLKLQGEVLVQAPHHKAEMISNSSWSNVLGPMLIRFFKHIYLHVSSRNTSYCNYKLFSRVKGYFIPLSELHPFGRALINDGIHRRNSFFGLLCFTTLILSFCTSWRGVAFREWWWCRCWWKLKGSMEICLFLSSILTITGVNSSSSTRKVWEKG